jgi:hypothetical protein
VNIPHDIENRGVATGIDQEVNLQVSGPFLPPPQVMESTRSALAGFMNAKGGTLLIGVHDTDGPMGLARDYKSLQKRPNRDGFENWLTTDVIRLRLGAQVMRIPLGSIPHAG